MGLADLKEGTRRTARFLGRLTNVPGRSVERGSSFFDVAGRRRAALGCRSLPSTPGWSGG
jgi:hypothetical protein